MSMVLTTRSPLGLIAMNGARTVKRRSARLSEEGAGVENGAPSKRTKVAGGAQTVAVQTKENDGGSEVVGRRGKRKVYDEEVDDFVFTKNKRAKASKTPAVRNSTAEQISPAKTAMPPPPPPAPVPAPADNTASKTVKKNRRRLPSTPERDAAEKTVRRSKRLSNEHEQTNGASPHKPAHAKSHAKQDRSPSPFQARPVTVEKKRRKGTETVEEEKIMRIQLPFADTPVIKRNKEMRKASAEGGSRRSSSGMRGRRASSLIDEGRGNGESRNVFERAFAALDGISLCPRSTPSTKATVLRSRATPIRRQCPQGPLTPPPSDNVMPRSPHIPRFIDKLKNHFADEPHRDSALPHPEVPSAEFYKHISAELTEPRRMRCLLGWCSTRALPPKPEAPKESTPAASLEFQALQAARVIQAELSSDLVTKGTLSDWFSRDENLPPVAPLQKRPNPRNMANAAKAEELERELERLKQQRAEWDQLLASVPLAASPPAKPNDGQLSPLNPDLLASPEREIFAQLQAPSADDVAPIDPKSIEQRLQKISENLEFTVDQFAHGVHALSTAKATAEKLAEKSLEEAAGVLEERERRRRQEGGGVGAMEALRGLARVLNGSGRR